MLRNMQHLCNLLRPVQARQTLLHTLRGEAEQRRAAAQELRCGGPCARGGSVDAHAGRTCTQAWVGAETVALVQTLLHDCEPV